MRYATGRRSGRLPVLGFATVLAGAAAMLLSALPARASQAEARSVALAANCKPGKIEPLRRKLSTVRAWATGQRRDQSPGTRSQVAVLELDTAFSTPDHPLYKFNPLAQMTSEEVWGYIRMLEIPYNSLHERGFISIGCEPCTRPVLPNQHEREGRWWWEEATHKECGLHAGNLIAKS